MKTIFKNKSVVLFTMIGVGAMLFSSCKKDSTPIVYGDAKVRTVNAHSTSSAQHFYQNDVKLSTTAVAYGTASSDYIVVKGGPSVISFKDATTGTATAAANVGIDEGSSYTVFYYKNSAGSGDITGFKDDNTAPASGKAKVRFLNMGFTLNNTLNITYASSGAVIVNDLGLSMSNYASIDANTDLGVLVLGSPVTGIIAGSNFVAGKIYTVWFEAASPTSVTYHVVAQN